MNRKQQAVDWVKGLVGERLDDFREFCKKNIVLDSGKPYDPFGRACMVEIVQQLFVLSSLAIEKGEQTGFSTLFIALCLFMADQQRRNIIYFLPTDEFVSLFTPTRFDPVIKRSPYLQSRLTDTDNKNAKQIGTNFLYIRGLKSKTGAISVPADLIVFDEVAATDKENMELAEGRVAASDLARRIWFSAPLYEEDNIDEIFQQSDQRAWTMPCPTCGTKQVAEEHWPDNIVKPKGGDAFLACHKCGAPLDVSQGEWVPKYPERTKVGYRVPQLIVPGMNMNLIYERLEEARRRPSRMAQLTRSVCGIPAAGAMQPINDKILARVSEAEPYYLQTHSQMRTFMGIDVGDTCNIAIRQPMWDGRARWIWFQEVGSDDLVEVACQLEQLYNVRGTIIDGMPYRPTSRKLVRSLKNWAAIHDFRGDETVVGEEGEDGDVKTVKSEREQSIEDMIDELLADPPIAFMPQARDLQQEELLKIVHRQVKKLVREEVATKAGKRVQFKHGVENHYGLAMTYAKLAEELHEETTFEYKPVPEAARHAKFGKGAY